jgi:murein DD-endopeptidase MepM/ murein hydrolase activator NlpD
MKKAILLVLVLLLSAGINSCGKTDPDPEPTIYQISMSPFHSEWPIVREASGQWEIVGEAIFSNTGTETVVIQTINVKVFNAEGDVLAERNYGSDKFNDAVMITIKSSDGTYTQTSASTSQLAPSDMGFCHVAALAGNSSLPTKASVTISFTNGKSETAEVQLYEFDPGQQTIWPAGANGGTWVAVNTAEAYHHWTNLNINTAAGMYGNSERFALDIMEIDGQYQLSNPPDSANKENYYCWGEEILSAGSGTVVDVAIDRVDQEIGSMDQEHPAGNYIVIQHAPGLFSMYAHMMYNSAVVNIGDPVSAGQVIGKIGNSGKSTAPHLQFQYMDSNDFSWGKGLPALFWGATVNRLSDETLRGIVDPFPDIRKQNYGLTAGTYTVNGSTLLEYDIITMP